MPICVTCPSCGQTGMLPEGLSAPRVKCPSCGTKIVVPSGPAQVHPERIGPSVPKSAPMDDDPAWWQSPKTLMIGGGVGGAALLLLVIVSFVSGRKGSDNAPHRQGGRQFQHAGPRRSRAREPRPCRRWGSSRTSRGARKTLLPLRHPKLHLPAPAAETASVEPPPRAPARRLPPVGLGPRRPPRWVRRSRRPKSSPSASPRSPWSGARIPAAPASWCGPDLVATNAHVIDDEFVENIEVRFPSAEDARKGPFKAELLYEDEARDLAFLRVKSTLPALEVAESYQYRKGEDVTVIGNPGLDGQTILENAISRGVMSTKTTLDGHNFYQLAIAINPGNSGGPVFDSTGRVIGVVTRKTTEKEALAFCIPVEDLVTGMDKVEADNGSEAAKAQSSHRTDLAFRLLSSSGAMFAVALDIQGKIFEKAPQLMTQPRGGGDLKEFDEKILEIDSQVFTGLADQADQINKDKQAPTAARGQFVELAKNYAKMRALFHKPGSDLNRYQAMVRDLKTRHRQLIIAMSSSLGSKPPDELMATLQDTPNGESIASLNSRRPLPPLLPPRPARPPPL